MSDKLSDYTFTAEVKTDTQTKDLYIEFDDELLKSLKWNVGDTLEWIDNEDGTFTIRKKDNG